jgi:hypothetical protein
LGERLGTLADECQSRPIEELARHAMVA